MTQSENSAEVTDLEIRRIAAMNAGDIDAIGAMLSDDYIQVHAHGRIDDKEAILQGLRATRPNVEREAPLVRLYGDVAVLTGEIVHRAEIQGQTSIFHIFTTQVAVKQSGTWKYVSTQATLLPQS